MSAMQQKTVYFDSDNRPGRPVARYAWRFLVAVVGMLVCVIVLLGTSLSLRGSLLSQEASNLAGFLVLGITMLAWCKLLRKRIGVRLTMGESPARVKAYAFLAITAAYLCTYAYSHAIGQPEEPYMHALFVGWSGARTACLLAAALFAAPVVEEIVFRHVVLNAVPWEKKGAYAVLAVLGSAFIFQAVHTNYVLLSTHVLLFVIGVILAVARIASQGLRLPMMLHAYSGLLGLGLHFVYT